MLHAHRKDVGEYLAANGIEPSQIKTQAPELTEEQYMIVSLQQQGMSLRKIAMELYEDEGKFMKVKRVLDSIGRAS